MSENETVLLTPFCHIYKECFDGSCYLVLRVTSGAMCCETDCVMVEWGSCFALMIRQMIDACGLVEVERFCRESWAFSKTNLDTGELYALRASNRIERLDGED